MLAETFGIEWIRVELPFACEIHWLRPRCEPNPTRFSVLLLHTEPDQFLLTDQQLLECSTNFNMVVLKTNRLNLPNAIEDCFGSTWIIESPKTKNFSVSYILSAGNHGAVLPGYMLRIEIYKQYNRIKNIPTKFYKSKYLDAFKKKIFEQEYEIDLPFLPNDQKLELFSSMFHIAVENISEKNYFTEKLVDCFRTFTIPIYHGCPNIGDYFDTDGMIQFTSPEELVEKLNNLTADSYYEKLDVIRQNYQKALPYFDPWARLATNIIEFKKTTHK